MDESSRELVSGLSEEAMDLGTLNPKPLNPKQFRVALELDDSTGFRAYGLGF